MGSARAVREAAPAFGGIQGALTVDGTRPEAGDGAVITDERGLRIAFDTGAASPRFDLG